MEDVEICTKPDGSLWNLGHGSFGTGVCELCCAVHSQQTRTGCAGVLRSTTSSERNSQILRRACAVYKALKGVETVAVKFCESLVSEKDQVG